MGSIHGQHDIESTPSQCRSHASTQDSKGSLISACTAYFIGVGLSSVLIEASQSSLVRLAVLLSLPDAELHLVLDPV